MATTLRQLEYAVALADRLHFGRAAEACGVSQPALSAQIRQLEEGLGARLFERSRRRVLLTPAGAGLVERARRVLREVGDLTEEVRGPREPLAGTIRLGVVPTVAPYLLPRILPEVRRAHPGLKLLLEEDRTRRILESLDRGELDLLLLASPAPRPDLETLPLFREHFVVVLPEDDPLAAMTAVRESDLEGRRVLLPAEGHDLREPTLTICRRAGAVELDEARGGSLSTLVQMVAGGLGPTLLPALAVSVEVPPGAPVTVRPFTRPAPSREVCLVWRRSSPRTEEFRLLGRLLKPALPRL